jgi:hypothetical protein
MLQELWTEENSLVGRARREYDTDQVTWDSRGNRDRYLGRWVDRVTRDSRGNQDYDLGWWAD